MGGEHFKVWMRVAAFPSFRKLFGIIHEDIVVEQGQDWSLDFEILNNFDVSSFGGGKSLVIAPELLISSENSVVGSACAVLGILCTTLGVSAFIQAAKCKRSLT